MADDHEPTILVLEHNIRKGCEKRYERWLVDTSHALAKSPGFLGREVFPPTGPDRPYVVVGHFQTNTDLQDWLDSSAAKALHRELRDLLDEDERPSIESSFDLRLGTGKKPEAYKVFVLTIAALYPLTQILPRALAPVFEATPVLGNPFISGLVLNILVVLIMSYMIMPRLTHRLRRWLSFKKTENRPKFSIGQD